jgi:hypothetical protein
LNIQHLAILHDHFDPLAQPGVCLAHIRILEHPLANVSDFSQRVVELHTAALCLLLRL